MICTHTQNTLYKRTHTNNSPRRFIAYTLHTTPKKEIACGETVLYITTAAAAAAQKNVCGGENF
jgi:hypothetical protein